MDVCNHCLCFGLFKTRKLKNRKNSNRESSSELEDPASRLEKGLEDSASLRHHTSITKEEPVASSRALTFTYHELAVATNNFSSECLIGRGGFGAVFRGQMKISHQVVAIKQLDQSGFQGDKEFLVEVLMLSLVHHDNLVNLIGFCAEGTHRLLVYEYMPLGSLERHLLDVEPGMELLDWKTRIKIAAGAARGLNSLHSANPPVIHRDLKAANILLDENFHPKLSDFGLAKFGPSGDNSHVSTRVLGTYGYCAPEYASTGRLTMKTDIYSFGIILLELITGRRAVTEMNGRQKHLIYWARPLMTERNLSKLADPLLKGQYSLSILKKAVEVVMMCINENARFRPSSNELTLAMDYLVSKLSKNSETNETWQDIGLTTAETTTILSKDLDRDLAVAEAIMWGENCRLKQQRRPPNESAINSWVDKVQRSK